MRMPMLTSLFQTLLLALCLAAGPLQAQVAAGATLLTPNAWQLDGGSQWQGEQLRVGPSTPESVVHLATRPVALPPGASWRARVTLAAVQPEAVGAAVGLTLHGADGAVVAVMLRVRERQLVIANGNARKWLGVLLQPVGAPALSDDAGAPHTLVVESQDSRLRVWLDGQEMGRGAVHDLEPVRIGVRALRGQALVQALSLEATGVDERLARLSGDRAVPGAAVLLQETFESGGAAKALTGLFGKLAGQAKAAPQAAATADDWDKNWSDANSIFERDLAAKRLVLQGLREESVAWTSPKSYYPLDYAATAITARLRLQVQGEGDRAGVMLLAREPAKPGGQLSKLAAQWGDNALWLHEYDAGKDDWALLRRVSWPAARTVDMTLRLVTRDDQAWVFVDGRLAIYFNNVEPLQVGAGALRAEGRTRLEASSFIVSEL
jgi:hypothetical protein